MNISLLSLFRTLCFWFLLPHQLRLLVADFYHILYVLQGGGVGPSVALVALEPFVVAACFGQYDQAVWVENAGILV
jgi:hypothetical protein